jgi:hypothetical protein
MQVLAITTIFTVLAGLFVAIRLWTRFRIVKSPGYDDLLITFALMCSITFYAFVLVECHFGLGIRKQYLSDAVVQGQMKGFTALNHTTANNGVLTIRPPPQYLWLSVPFHNLSLVLSKLSILVLFIRIIRSRKFLICAYSIMAFLLIAGLWMVLM